MESARVKQAIEEYLINDADDDNINKLPKLRHWLVLALENDLAKVNISSKEYENLMQELHYAKNQDPYSHQIKHRIIATASMVGIAAHEIARRTKENEIVKAEEDARNIRQKALMLALKKEYEEAFLAEKEATEAEHTVSAKKERNVWYYLWDLITCQLR